MSSKLGYKDIFKDIDILKMKCVVKCHGNVYDKLSDDSYIRLGYLIID